MTDLPQEFIRIADIQTTNNNGQQSHSPWLNGQVPFGSSKEQ